MIPLIIICFAMGVAVLAFLFGTNTIAGVDIEKALPLTGAVLMATFLLSGSIGQYRGQMSAGLKAAAAWLAIGLVVVAGYTYRFEFASIGNRIVGALVPGTTLFGDGGEVTVSRGSDGQFHFMVEANGTPLRMMFDTGASSVVIRSEDATRMGLKLQDSDFTVTVRTANGTAQAAPITLKTLKIGGVSEDNVRAMVAKPGLLGVNLLGMTFLERLSSYEVRAEQLTLRGRGN